MQGTVQESIINLREDFGITSSVKHPSSLCTEIEISQMSSPA